jgi:hypothetical protein
LDFQISRPFTIAEGKLFARAPEFAGVIQVASMDIRPEVERPEGKTGGSDIPLGPCLSVQALYLSYLYVYVNNVNLVSKCLNPRIEDHVEWRRVDIAEPACGDDLAKACLAGSRAECGTDLLR